ncbi:MAG: hypothetical protein QXL17_04295 [Candidatus Thermoplasmatota archaeon]
MNREALPFILAICIPFIIVSMVFLYLSGSNIIIFFRSIDPIYYVIILPFALGLFAALLKVRKPK